MRFFKLKDEFIRQTGLMFIGVGLFNLFNLLYHFFMVRFHSPIDYGHLNTLMALFKIISVPASTVQTTVTKFVSSFYAQISLIVLFHKTLTQVLIIVGMVSVCLLGANFYRAYRPQRKGVQG